MGLLLLAVQAYFGANVLAFIIQVAWLVSKEVRGRSQTLLGILETPLVAMMMVLLWLLFGAPIMAYIVWDRLCTWCRLLASCECHT